jgi:hypothetical protein
MIQMSDFEASIVNHENAISITLSDSGRTSKRSYRKMGKSIKKWNDAEIYDTDAFSKAHVSCEKFYSTNYRVLIATGGAG